MHISSDTARLLMEVGVMAALRGDTADAGTILTGLQEVRPESPAPLIGQAIARMNEGRYEIAIEELDRALGVDDTCDFARVLKAIAWRQSGYDSRSRGLCEDVVAAERSDLAIEVAKMLLAMPPESVTHAPTIP